MTNKPIYRMSGVGDCPRALSAEKLSYPVEEAPFWLERAAKEGNRHEIWIKEDLKEEGITVYGEQLEVRIEEPEFVLLGHIDGLVNDNGTDRLLEVKTMSQYEFDRWMKDRFDGFPRNSAQLTCYMAATERKEALYLVKNRSSGYIDRTVYDFTPENIEDIIEKVRIIEEHVQQEILVDVAYMPDSIQCKRCNYKNLCISEPTEFESIPEAILFDAAANWRTGKQLELESKELMNEAKDIFLRQTEASGQKKWKFEGLSIVKVDVKESVTYPKTKLLEVFGADNLAPAAEVKIAYSFIRIDDLDKESR